jgi:tetratricopeptide (TPR) repeat protein
MHALRALATWLSCLILATAVTAAGGERSQAKTRPREKTPTPATRNDAAFEQLRQQAAAARDAGRLEEAVDLYRTALREKPSWVEGRWYLATSYYELDRPSEALESFRRVLERQPDNAAARAFIGLCEFQLKRYQQALSDLMIAREQHVGANKELRPVVRYHAAILATRFQQFELALQILGEFAAEGNNGPKVIEAMGLATLRIPSLPDELPAERREQVLLAGQGAYYLHARTSAAARAAFEELIQKYPRESNVHYAYGVSLLKDDPDRAIDQFKKELEASPGHVPSLLQIAFEYIKRSDWAAARPWATNAVERAPDNFPARQALGQILLELNEVDAAIQQLQAGIAIAPDSPSAHFMLARAYQKAGRKADAERERLEFLRLDKLVQAKQQPAAGQR